MKQGKKLTRAQKIGIGKLLGDQVYVRNLMVIREMANTLTLLDKKTGIFHVVEKNEI